MEDIAIIGAGDLGGALADALARLDIAAAIRLIDDAGAVAEGKALDIMQAGPIEGFSTAVSGSSDLAAAGGRRSSSSPIAFAVPNGGARTGCCC